MNGMKSGLEQEGKSFQGERAGRGEEEESLKFYKYSEKETGVYVLQSPVAHVSSTIPSL